MITCRAPTTTSPKYEENWFYKENIMVQSKVIVYLLQDGCTLIYDD